MLAIWITHWNCIKHQKEWSDQAAYYLYESIIKPTNDRVPFTKGKEAMQWMDNFGVLRHWPRKTNQTICMENVQMLPVSKHGRIPRRTSDH